MNELYYQLSLIGPGVLDLSAHVESVLLEEDRGSAAMLSFRLPDRAQVLAELLHVGREVELRAGTEGEHSLLFRGTVLKLEGTYSSEEGSALKVQAYDRAMRLGLRKRARAFPSQVLSERVRQVAAATFADHLRFELDDDSLCPPDRQVEETDLAFLLRLCARYHCDLSVEIEGGEEILALVSHSKALKRAPTATFYGPGIEGEPRLQRFEATLDASLLQIPQLYAGLDLDRAERLPPVASAAPLPSPPADPYDQELRQRWAEENPTQVEAFARFLEAPDPLTALARSRGEVERAGFHQPTASEHVEARRSAVPALGRGAARGEGEAGGDPALRPGRTVDIVGVGPLFSGSWLLTRTRHHLGQGSYRTEFVCAR